MTALSMERKISFFKKNYSTPDCGHWVYACHAAFPIFFTPDLLFRLWQNFSVYHEKKNVPQKIAYTVVSDLLLSNLCRELSSEIFEMDLEVRRHLLNELKSDDRFGQRRILELADFLFEYAKRNLRHPDDKYFRNTHQWTGLATSHPQEAIIQIGKALSGAIEQNKSGEIERLFLLLDRLTESDARFQDLIEFSKGVKEHAFGNTDYVVKMPVLTTNPNSKGVKILTLPIPNSLRGKIERNQVKSSPLSFQPIVGGKGQDSFISSDIGKFSQGLPKSSQVISHPRVFISYSHDSPEHVEKVLEFSEKLRTDGIDTRIDQYSPWPKEGWPRWIERHLEAADFVLMVCTEIYQRRVTGKEEPGIGKGVCWEAMIIYNNLYNKKQFTSKYIPILFEGGQKEHVPSILSEHNLHRVNSKEGYNELYRRITNQPIANPGPIGNIRKLLRLKSMSSQRKDTYPSSRAIDMKVRKFFISYAHGEPDEENLARFLHTNLTNVGHESFIDIGLKGGMDWVAQIRNKITWCDCIILLLSKNSMEREMVHAEVRLA